MAYKCFIVYGENLLILTTAYLIGSNNVIQLCGVFVNRHAFSARINDVGLAEQSKGDVCPIQAFGFPHCPVNSLGGNHGSSYDLWGGRKFTLSSNPLEWSPQGH